MEVGGGWRMGGRWGVHVSEAQFSVAVYCATRHDLESSAPRDHSFHYVIGHGVYFPIGTHIFEALKKVFTINPGLLLSMYNTCFVEGMFPSLWKTARLVLISKRKGDPELPSYYTSLHAGHGWKTF
ncbi:hypothetical protein J6590_071753 [Homalodisca vitripennis]|nr:hypothetical protein J6590_071753 [Homalodisca vitripennis]